ncbi:unnamed protein product [Peronospora farinosa]|uniref:Uncharacterized protein n=1 Tax=Peronospora farinosa TaxID=134698 RepID=A0AAV0UWH3_9STRA|nr:unnamed protein product [Peronospora farinosa]CAI5741286.1 unnamed protein product [Peronospora farinosa]
MTKERLLRLLLLHDRLETLEEWDSIFRDDKEKNDVVDAVTKDEEQKRSRCPAMIIAMDEVVPYLPDYSPVSAKLKALMRYSESTYFIQVNRLVQGWLQQVHSIRFRTWLLCDWLKCSHLTISMDPVMLLQWRHVLWIATINETVKSLKRTLLQFLSLVNETIEAHSKCNKVITASEPVLQSIETVVKLLDFCFLHAEQLASYSLLCAAKMHALAIRTERSTIKLSQEEEVLVRLRWSLMLKPMLSKPLLQHAIAFKTVAESITTGPLWTSTLLSDLVGLVDVTSRERILREMAATRDELERAFTRNAEHIHGVTSKMTHLSIHAVRVETYIQSLSDKEKQLLLAELERDLDEAPPHLFPHVFIFLALILRATLSSTARELQSVATEAIVILFALFERRTHDVDSCVDVLSLLLELSLAHNSIWLKNSRLYIQMIELLSEITTLQVDHKLKWITKMALHQLVFECDIQLLLHHQSTLLQLLPPCIRRLVSD